MRYDNWHISKTIFGLSILVSLCSCSVAENTSKNISCGKVSIVMRVYDSATNAMNTIKYQKDPIIYYRDSLIIEETFRAEIETDIFEKKTWRTYPWEITFIDLPNRNFYVFSSLSDTATLIRKYTQADSVKGNLANFWGLHSSFKDEETEIVGDTIIDGISYKMFKKIEYVPDGTQPKELIPVYSIAYLACNITKPQIFTLDRLLSQKHNYCPVKRTDRFVTGDGSRLVMEIQYLSDTLTSKEEKVFKAWAKYAKEHPVEK